MKIAVFSSLAFSLVNFRGNLLQDLRHAGHEVIAVAPDRDAAVEAKLAEWGIGFEQVPMARAGTNLLSDFGTLAAYVRMLRRHRPGAVIAYTQKPIIYGGIAARLCGIKRFYALMSGLGYLFSDAASGRRVLKAAFCRLYREGLRGAKRIFVFNSDDRPDMLAAGIVSFSSPVVQVPGSGVDVERFAQAPLPDGPIHFLMIGRLMRDKGVWEYAEAARQVRALHPEARFSLIGRPEPSNPTGLDDSDIARLSRDYPVERIPETNEIPRYLASAHAFVLPSYYREGLPRTILEALAVGRPVITTDMAGCRDAVVDGENGLLVQPRDAAALADAMLRLAGDRQLVHEMAARSRKLAEDVYDVRKVNALLLREMDLDRISRVPDHDGERARPGPTQTSPLAKGYH
ncbi:glycosyltransferase family 4 protein [Qipengyuania sp. XHP0207]|uniref:glycosyltransferase family 4 protein n=1 Tax=Qipengyuania sp. XHP0207 TaxID=3038078 RepID=UPI00241EBFB3|nr:glycosyltransferase family 4 protein [Qipengyuania sp. XHP0207]MDG5747727.1 glycosyltransferase family 4 protein [Qipengyuania sp. XHP0207]